MAINRARYWWFRGQVQASYAIALARAEQWYAEREWAWSDDPDPRNDPDHGTNAGALRFRWIQDEDYRPDDYDIPMPEIAWGCILEEWCGRGWHAIESLWNITFGGDGCPSGDPYARVVEAELALEAMPEPETSFVIPDPCELT